MCSKNDDPTQYDDSAANEAGITAAEHRAECESGDCGLCEELDAEYDALVEDEPRNHQGFTAAELGVGPDQYTPSDQGDGTPLRYWDHPIHEPDEACPDLAPELPIRQFGGWVHLAVAGTLPTFSPGYRSDAYLPNRAR